jgi:ABC-type branched-subunit amino acid transport system ATPase component
LTVQLELRDVSKRFGTLAANDRVTAHVTRGEILGLIGPNGSGKTTLFNSVTGHFALNRGTVHFEGLDITGWRTQCVARLGLLRTFQRSRTYHAMTCLENVLVSVSQTQLRLQNLGLPFPVGMEQTAVEMLEFVGIQDQRHQLASELSFGQQRLLELAMALMARPKILLLDEPTAGINPGLIGPLLERLKSVNRELGTTLVIIEHNMPVIMGLADRIYCLNRGQILAEGSPAEIQRDPRVVQAYLGAR